VFCVLRGDGRLECFSHREVSQGQTGGISSHALLGRVGKLRQGRAFGVARGPSRPGTQFPHLGSGVLMELPGALRT
jgi:hypothetical protein